MLNFWRLYGLLCMLLCFFVSLFLCMLFQFKSKTIHGTMLDFAISYFQRIHARFCRLSRNTCVCGKLLNCALAEYWYKCAIKDDCYCKSSICSVQGFFVVSNELLYLKIKAKNKSVNTKQLVLQVESCVFYWQLWI